MTEADYLRASMNANVDSQLPVAMIIGYSAAYCEAKFDNLGVLPPEIQKFVERMTFYASEYVETLQID